MERLIVYSAKFLCGPARGLEEGVQPGSYSTAINVHNPHNVAVYLFKKVVIAQREDEPRGRISAFRKVMLNPDEAIEIDCIDIVRFFGAQQETGVTAPSQQTQTSPQTIAVPTVTVRTLEAPVRFIKGFVVIYATAPLDVVGVYTASTPVGFSLDIEQIPRSTVGVLPIPIPEEPEGEVCPQGCYCLTKDEALGKLGPNATMCVDQPCDKDVSGVLRYCWRPGEGAECPTGCVCLYKEDAYKRYGQDAALCQEQPCAYDERQTPLYCYKPTPPPPPTQTQCPQECVCLTKDEAYAKLGPNATICQNQPCGYAAGTTAAIQIEKYCWKPATQETQCPTGCECLTETEGNQPGYALCQNQRMQCGQATTGALMYCYQKSIATITPVTVKPGRILITPSQARNPVGTQHTITITVYDTNGKPMSNARVKISHTGANSFPSIELTTDGNGKANYSYTGKNTGFDTITASIDNLSATATKEWYKLTPLTVPPTLIK